MATFEEWQKELPDSFHDFSTKNCLAAEAAYHAGAASRDAEVAGWTIDRDSWRRVAEQIQREKNDLRSKIEAARAQMTEVKQSRTAWLEQHGVPISEEFVRFANSIGELETALGKQGEGR